MADNVTIPATGTGSATPVIATDDVDGIQFQKIKLDGGGNGLSEPIEGTTANGIDVDVTRLPALVAGTNVIGKVRLVTANGDEVTEDTGDTVKISDGGGAITVDGTVTANAGTNLNTSALALESGGNLAAAAASLAILDNAISGNEMQVDVLTMPTVAVTQSGTWDEVGINDSGNSITVDNAQLSVVGSGTEATALRVTIATDSTGVLSIDDNGASITVDGSVTANAGTNLNTSALALESGGNLEAAATSLAALGNAVSGNELQVDVLTLPALAAGTNNIGDVDILSIAAGDNNIGNVDIVTMPNVTIGAALPAGTNAIGKLAANSGVDIGDVDVTSLPQTGSLISATMTRPNDTTTYAAGDTISDSTSAPTANTANGFARASGGSGRITSLQLIMSTAASLKANLEIWVFDASYTNNNDNAAWSPSDADSQKVVAIIPLGGTPFAVANNVVYSAGGLCYEYICTSGTALYWTIVVKNAYIPAAQETFKLRFGVEFTS